MDNSLGCIKEEYRNDQERPRALSNILRLFGDFDRPIRVLAYREINNNSDKELPINPSRRFSRNLSNNILSSSSRSPRQDSRPIKSIKGRLESSRRELSS